MLTTRAASGVVTRKDGEWLTLLLRTGKKETVKCTDGYFAVGTTVIATFNHTTGKIEGVHKPEVLGGMQEAPKEKIKYIDIAVQNLK